MDIMKWVYMLQNITLVLFGIYIGRIGLEGLIQKRPLIFPSRQPGWFIVTIFILTIYIPGLIQSLTSFSKFWELKDPFFILPPFIQLTILILLIFIFWRYMTGYIIYGISDETFRNTLTNALNKLSLLYEKSTSEIKLLENKADLQVGVESWIGIAQIRIRQSEHAHLVKEIAYVMDDYYKNNSVKVNNRVFILHLLFGILLTVFIFATQLAIFALGFILRAL